MTPYFDKINEMVAEIESIIESTKIYEEKYASYLSKVHPKFRESALNLVHYRALRSHDIRKLQKKLGNLGLSRLAKAESHVLASLFSTIKVLKALQDESYTDQDHNVSLKDGTKLQNRHAKALFGNRSKDRNVRIMVTQPSDSAEKPDLIQWMIKKGMDTARINCAHDDPAVWKQIIDHAKQAMADLKLNCKISMDLGGPKIRTGEVKAGPKLIRIRPPKDVYGRIVNAVTIELVPNQSALISQNKVIPVGNEWLQKLEIGEKIFFRDGRDKKRNFRVEKKTADRVEVSINKPCYITTGTILRASFSGFTTEVGELPQIPSFITLCQGDSLVLHKDPQPGESAITDASGNIVEPAHISCTSEEIFQVVKEGERILFDDGQIGGLVEKVTENEIHVTINQAGESGSKLRADKGINLPDSNLKISGLTQKDKEDLKFVTQHADVVNMSFVNHQDDVEALLQEIEACCDVDHPIGIILKIETKSGFQNLIEILLTAMRIYPVGVMIARGDLAIETGWQNIGRIQEEILWLCQAAHVPTIWATQVFENLAKKGIPSRAEITDAVMSQRADCVMLNKGPYILQAVEMLDTILRNMQNYQEKKSPMLPAIEMT